MIFFCEKIIASLGRHAWRESRLTQGSRFEVQRRQPQDCVCCEGESDTIFDSGVFVCLHMIASFCMRMCRVPWIQQPDSVLIATVSVHWIISCRWRRTSHCLMDVVDMLIIVWLFPLNHLRGRTPISHGAVLPPSHHGSVNADITYIKSSSFIHTPNDCSVYRHRHITWYMMPNFVANKSR